MGTPATVPMFAPDGSLGDIPYERMHEALTAGAKMGVYIKAPDGSQGIVPADRTNDAIKAGGKVVPYNLDASHQQEGFWKSFGGDLKGLLTPQGQNPYPGMGVEQKVEAANSASAADEARKASGHGIPYRVGATVISPITNVQGMEQAAEEGDTAGVLGHAAAGTTVAAAPLIGEGVSKVGKSAIEAIQDKMPSTQRAGQTFQAVSKAAGDHAVNVTPQLSDALMQYQQLVDSGGSRSLAVSKLLTRLTNPEKGPLTYDEARLFQSNISRLSADEAQRLTPVMKRQVGQIAAELNGAVENTAAGAGKLAEFQSAMKEYAQAKTNEARAEVLKKWGIKAAAAATLGAAGATGIKLMHDLQ